MTTAEPYRPKLHFSPRVGWINDPNGLIHVDGRWHLFYQHQPNQTTHGPMHWGHASSTDLTDWTEHPIALYPDAQGDCWSGSAIEAAPGDVRLFYTAAIPQLVGQPWIQTQCMARADGSLTHFSSEPQNPVLPNPGLNDFRDPKVVWHAPSARWIMVVTHGQSIGFHSSADLIHWRLESSFGQADGRHSEGPWECPDLFAMTTPDGRTKWVLVVGIGWGTDAGGSGTQYFVGEFDGRRFTNDNDPATVLWLDNGRDYYATQSFSGAGAPITISWASNWQYAGETPTVAFRGIMSLPRQLSLVDTPAGLRLRQIVPPMVVERFDPMAFGTTPAGGTYRIAAQLDLASGQSRGIALFGEAAAQFVFHRAPDGTVLVRARRAQLPTAPRFATDHEIRLPADTPLDLQLYVDNGVVELGIGDGLHWMTNLFFPADPAGAVRLVIGE